MRLANYLSAYVLYPLAESRLSRNIRPRLDTIRRDRRFSKKDREARQRAQLRQILESAGARVPYYRDLFKTLAFDPRKVGGDVRYLYDLPYLTKEIIKEQGSRMLRDGLNPALLHPRKTGGSTGISTILYYDQEALDWTAAINLYAQGFTGRRHVDQEAHLSTNFHQKLHWKSELIERAKCLAMNRSNIYTDRFSDEGMAELWDTIRRIRPYLLQGHPSTVYALSLYLQRSGKKDPGAVRVFESTGESLDDRKIESIEKHVGCKVYNRYGTAEFGVTAHSRQDPRKLEIIDFICHHETDRTADGQSELIGTTTTNFAMPLIRYRTGDVAEIERGDEADYLVRLQGRIHDLIRINGKPYPTHYLQDVLDRVGGLEEFQIVETREGKQTLNIVLEDMSKQEAIRARMNELFGEGVTVAFVRMDDLVRVGWRDKFRYLIKEQ